MTRRTGEPDSLPARARRWFRRALAFEGHERDTAVLVLKATLAATLAWAVAHDLMQATTPAFAPFAALLMVQATLYRSLLRSLRMVAAVLLGIALVTALATLIGTTTAVFAATTLAALAIGRWRRLGDQGTQVATAAFFAFSVFVTLHHPPQLLTQAAEILAVVLIGSATGVAVNLVLLPPLRLRGAARGVAALAGGLRRLCEDMGDTLREGLPHHDTARPWQWRTDDLLHSARQAREATGTARESTYWNPRGLLHRGGRTRVKYHDLFIDALERNVHRTAAIARSLAHGHRQDDEAAPAVVTRCGDLLLAAADAWRVLEEWEDTDAPGWDPPARRFHEQVQRTVDTEHLLVQVRGDGDGPALDDPALPYGALLVEAARLLDDLREADEALTASTRAHR